MALLLDTHLHVHPGFAPEAVVDALWERLDRLASRHSPGAALGACLAERRSEGFFRSLPLRMGAWSVEEGTGPAHRLLRRGDHLLHLFAGRQIVSSERLEVLGLFCDAEIPDGQSAQDVIAAVWAAGGFPVMPWSTGKWLFRRGARVSSLIRGGRGPGALADMARRPGWWIEPLFALARRRRLPILGGSDPLPIAGQERLAGRMASLYPGNLDARDPVAGLKLSWLREPESWTVVRDTP